LSFFIFHFSLGFTSKPHRQEEPLAAAVSKGKRRDAETLRRKDAKEKQNTQLAFMTKGLSHFINTGAAD